MVKLGKIIFKKLEDSDLDKLKIFCDSCKKLGYVNNSNFENIKLNQMRMPYGQYFIGYDTDRQCIWNLAGIHHLPEVGPNVWRVLFRGAQLPGYTIGAGKDFLRISHHWRYFLPLQIQYIQAGYPNAEFVVTTNVKNSSAGKSDRLDKKVMPPLLNRGIVSLYKENFELFNTKQNVWLIDVDCLTQALVQYQLSRQT